MNYKLSFAIGVMYIGFIVHFYYDEGLLSKKSAIGPFPFPKTLPIWCYIANIVASYLIMVIQKTKIPKNPFPYIYVAIPQMAGTIFSNMAKKYVDYPTLNVLKSAKPISVMLCSMIIFRKPVPKQRVVVVVILTAGLIVFGLKGNFGGSSMYGAVLAGGALICDALYVPVVDSLKSKSNSPYVTMFYTYIWSFIISIALNFNEVTASIDFIVNDTRFLPSLCLFALTGAIAQVALFTAIGLSDGLIVSIATTTRKFFTILLSSILYHHKMTIIQWIGIGIVFIALGIEIFAKKPHKQEKNKDE